MIAEMRKYCQAIAIYARKNLATCQRDVFATGL
jgi:hypothetical protein